MQNLLNEIKETETKIANTKREVRQLFRHYQNTHDEGKVEEAKGILTEHDEAELQLENYKGYLAGLKRAKNLLTSKA